MIRKCCEADQRFHTITNCIIPVGGYEQTARLAINTKSQLLGESSVYAIWDADVFTDVLPVNERISNIYNTHRDVIFNLGCTPEVWMIDKLESLDEAIVSSLRERFHHEVNSVLHDEAYVKCRAGNPRKLAKKKMEVVVAQFSAACGDSQEIVRDAFAEILIEKAYSLQNIQRIVNPMLTRT